MPDKDLWKTHHLRQNRTPPPPYELQTEALAASFNSVPELMKKRCPEALRVVTWLPRRPYLHAPDSLQSRSVFVCHASTVRAGPTRATQHVTGRKKNSNHKILE